VGTIRSQLSRGRQHLRRRLIHRGLAPAVALFALTRAALAQERIVPSALVSATVECARKFAVAQTVTAGVVGSAASSLADGFLRRLIMVRIQLAAIVVLGSIAIATAGAFALDREADKPAPPSDAKREILALSHAWKRAIVDGDVGTMDRLLAYELVGTDPEGWIWDKTKYLDHVKRRAFQVVAVDLKDIRIQVYGDAAVETGIGVGHYDRAKPPWIAARGHIADRFTRTWIKRHGSWQCVAFQTTVTERAEDPVAGNTPAAGKTESPGTAHVKHAVPFVDLFLREAKAAVSH
jgi:hypothetical protein